MFDMLNDWYKQGLMTSDDLKIWVPGTLSEYDYQKITDKEFEA